MTDTAARVQEMVDQWTDAFATHFANQEGVNVYQVSPLYTGSPTPSDTQISNLASTLGLLSVAAFQNPNRYPTRVFGVL
jgi:hypothetical protein